MKKKIFIWEIERELFWVKWLKMGIARFYLSCNYSCIIYFKVKILLVKLKNLYTSANLNPNHGTTHMHGYAVYVKEGLPFACSLSLENSADSYLCFRLALLHSVSYFSFLYQSPSSSLCTVFDSISSNIDEFSQLTYLLMCFSLETLVSIIRTD